MTARSCWISAPLLHERQNDLEQVLVELEQVLVDLGQVLVFDDFPGACSSIVASFLAHFLLVHETFTLQVCLPSHFPIVIVDQERSVADFYCSKFFWIAFFSKAITWCFINRTLAAVAHERCLSIILKKSVNVVWTWTRYLANAACSSTIVE